VGGTGLPVDTKRVGCSPRLHPCPVSIINDYRILKHIGCNCPYSDDDKIDTDYVIQYPGKHHYDDAKNKRDDSP
jgi:hypothetical protein